MSLYALCLRASTVIAQVTGFSNALELVRPSFMGGALAASVRDPVGTWGLVRDKSGEMAGRFDTLERDIRAGLQRLEGKQGSLAAVQRVAFYGVGMADRMVTVPTWLGAYNQHLASYPADEAGAVRAGDRAVRLTQGSGAAKDLSGVMGNRNSAAQFLTMFYSYFNLQYARLRTLGRDTRQMVRRGTYEDMPHLIARSIYLVALPAVLGDLLVGKLWDDEEEPAWWAFKKVSLYPFMSIPLARDVASSIDSGFDYKFTPLSRVPETAIKLGKGVANVFTDDFDARMTAKNAAELSGYVFGLPIGQAVQTADNVWKGIEQNDFKAKDLLFSRRSYGDERE